MIERGISLPAELTTLLTLRFQTFTAVLVVGDPLQSSLAPKGDTTSDRSLIYGRLKYTFLLSLDSFSIVLKASSQST